MSTKNTNSTKEVTEKTTSKKATTTTTHTHESAASAKSTVKSNTSAAASSTSHTVVNKANAEKGKTFSMDSVREEIFQANKERFKNIHMVPKITHITISACCSRHMNDGGKMTQVEQQLRNITCQQPAKTFARQSNASFKLRQGMHIGFVITLRGARASQFLFKLLYVNMPRIQDFPGLTFKSFDNNGNYNIGLKDINAFIETNHDLVTNVGMNISIATTSTHKEDTILLFKALRFPFVEFLK